MTALAFRNLLMDAVARGTGLQINMFARVDGCRLANNMAPGAAAPGA